MLSVLKLIWIAAALVVPSQCYMLVRDGPVPARLWREGDAIQFATDRAHAQIEMTSFRLRFADAAGSQRAVEAAGALRYERAGATHVLGEVTGVDVQGGALILRVETDEGPARVALQWLSQRMLEVSVDPPAPLAGADPVVTQFGDAWELRDGESIYGLSSRTGSQEGADPDVPPQDDVLPTEAGGLDRRGERVEMFVQPTIALYTPFYESSAGYGLYVDRTTIGAFDVGMSQPDRLDYQFEGGTTDAHRRLRFDLFLGPDTAQILDEYTARTGRPFRPPDWFFEHWRWRDELRVGAPVLLDGVPQNADFADDIAHYDALGLPAGVYEIDRPYTDGAFGFDNFRFDETRLPNPAQMFQSLAARGWRLAVFSTAWALGDQPGDNGSEARANGYLAPNGDRVIDLTNPAARAWWIQKHVDFVRSWNIAAIKLDRGEEYVPSQPTDVWADGRTGRELRNDYPRMQLEAYHEAMQQARGDDFVIYARSSWAGAQRYGVFWSGDVPGSRFFGGGPGTDLGLRMSIIGLLRAGMMGLPFWGSDTGGYYQFKQRDVFARWLEFSAFCPFMEIGGGGTHAPWAMPTSPSDDLEMTEIYRRYVQLHHDMIPYALAHVDEAVGRGVPIARPLVLAYPDDPRVRDLWDEYLYGADLLVAPLWRNGARGRDVYLPAGDWEDFWERGARYRGPATIAVDAPLDQIPVFVRAGAAVPGRP